MPAKITVSIVAYKTDALELACSIRSAHRTTYPHEVCVVDNSPNASLRSLVQAEGAVYVKADANLGYGAAHNLVLRKVQSPFCLVLNPDCTLQEGVLDELVEFLGGNDQVGLVMPRVLSPDGSEQHLCKLLPGPVDLVLRRFGGKFLSSIAEKSMGRLECAGLDLDQPMNVPWLSGCFMLMRTAALRQIGLFDERFFLYFEDLDLCRRIHREFDTVFYPYVSVTHRHERGSYNDANLLRMHIRSAVRYFGKYGWFFDRERRSVNTAAEMQRSGCWKRMPVAEEAAAIGALSGSRNSRSPGS